MRIKDLPAPVTAAKADWLAGTTWIGFTPTGGDLESRNQCQATIQHQFGRGYVVEYVTKQFNQPNPGFERDPAYLAERQAHRELAGRLIAVHKLKTTSRPLQRIIGDTDYKKLQDMWAKGDNRYRWSVAFPIIESYAIKGRPEAEEVFGAGPYRRLFRHPSATLRELNDDERKSISDLQIERVDTDNAWIGIEDEIEAAELSQIDPLTQRQIDRDLGALEGMAEERRIKIRKRAAWKADQFIRERQRNGRLVCDTCKFDPATLFDPKRVRLRRLLEVHHKDPLAEGVRLTTTADFALLCPTCHKVEHVRLQLGSKGF
ncbi:HNH endonuclease [Xanthobacter versatilis]|uniref:HNH endonuclease n=1 Tax=Xanthobacter autotrophicus (strain ATCC BAA-1158 / Py2) TaxID=78245 RepID=UPI00372977ED